MRTEDARQLVSRRSRLSMPLSREYALEHPLNIFLKEDILTDPVDTWLAEIFEPERVEHTLTQLEAAQPDAMATPNLLQQSITECDRKLAKHRAALEAGADPAMVAAWSSDIYRERAALIAQLTATTHNTRPPPTHEPR
ncbi:hypothetical protein AB0H49_05285 [Nocardia sp. NPDC050713]|uniref:hypothetical protein n=1 Tax=Nocardia sp. NPDC050713 TaxID=3154511 RepID=UPI0033DC6709